MNKNYCIKKSDLIGDIKDFPIEIVEKMIEEQVKQGCDPDVKVFQNNIIACADNGGFDWDETKEGDDFWECVISRRMFHLFFEKYPNAKYKNKFVYIIGDSEIGEDIIRTLEKYGGINQHNYKGDSNDCVYFIEPNNNFIEVCSFSQNPLLWEVLLATYTPIDAEKIVFEVTMEEIAEKFGVDVANLKIKGK